VSTGTRRSGGRSQDGAANKGPAFARSASASSRRSFSGGGSEPAKPRASDGAGESEGRSPLGRDYNLSHKWFGAWATVRASERSERATRTERAGEAASERACKGVRGTKSPGSD
jgi:hypothetical protein